MFSRINKIAVFIMFIGLFNTAKVFSLTNSNATISSYGFYPDRDSKNPLDNFRCSAAGNKCSMAIIADVKVSSHPEIENVYIIEIEFTEISSVYQGDSTTKYLHDVKGFTLPKDFKLQILNCHEYPIVDGMIFDLGDKTLNDNGSLILNIYKDK